MQYKKGYDYTFTDEYHGQEGLIPASGSMRALFIVLPLCALILMTVVLVLGVSKSQKSHQKMFSPISEEEEAVYRIKNDTPRDYTPYTVAHKHDDRAEEGAGYIADKEISPSVTEGGLAEMISLASGVPEERVSNPTQTLETPIEPQESSNDESEEIPQYIAITGNRPEEVRKEYQGNKNSSGGDENAQAEKKESKDSGGKVEAELKSSSLNALPLSAASSKEKAFTPTWKKRWVAVDLANIREDATIDSERLTQVIKGAVLTEIETNGDWSYVEVDPKCKGYIFSNLLSDEEVEPNEEEPEMIYSAEKLEEIQTPCDVTLYSNASVVRIRKTPSLNGEIITEMYYGDYVQAVSWGYDWYKVALKGGKFGYVHGKYLQKEPIEIEDLLNDETHQHEVIEQMEAKGYSVGKVQNTLPSTVSQGALGLVDLAMQYVGYPYVYGATGPNAFDCSGFVQFLHAQMGVSVGRTTYQQVHDGVDVPFAPDDFSHMLPGDIILLASGSDVYHSMIYIGNGKVVHAGTPATGVNVDNLAYYAHHMAYVKRIFY